MNCIHGSPSAADCLYCTAAGFNHDAAQCQNPTCQWPQCSAKRAASHFGSASNVEDFRRISLSPRQQDAAADAYFGELLGQQARRYETGQ